MQADPGLAAAILAGGRARRFAGVNKAALDVGGRTIADRQFEALSAVAAPVFVVGGASQPWPAGVRVVPDAVADGGALGGIYTAIVESPRERVLVIGCDLPFLTPAFLRHLAAVRDADIVIPRTEHGLEPLCAIYLLANVNTPHDYARIVSLKDTDCRLPTED